MFRRLGWIVASYFTRPLILAVVAGGLLFVSIIWFAKPRTTYYRDYPQLLTPHWLVDSQATLEAVRREGRQAEVDGINLNSLWMDMHRPVEAAEPTQPREVREFRPPGEAFFRILEEFPNLRIVTVKFYGHMTGAEQIVRLRNLEYLSIDGVARADLSWMRPLAKLRWLELALFTPPTGLKTLETLPNLETMVFRSRLEVTDEVLETMADLPHLKQLVLDFGNSSMPDAQLTAEGFAALGRSKSLETLYVGGFMPQDTGELLAVATGALPRLDVHPSRVAERQPNFVGVFPVTFFAMAIGFGLAAQFRGPLSRLAPGFVASHALVASVFFAATVLLGATRLMAAGCDPLASTIVSAALVAAAVCAVSGDPTPSPTNSWMRQMGGNLVRMVIFFSVLGLLVVSERRGAEILEGNRPWILVLLGLVAVAAIGVTVNGLRQLVMSSASTSLRDRGGFSRRWLLQSQSAAGWTFGLSRTEHKIDAWKSGRPRWTWWNRVRRWRVGNTPLQSVPYVLMFLGSYVAFLFLLRTMLLRGPKQDFSGLRAQSLIVIFLLLLMTAGRVAYAWRARMLTLPLEILRPYSRRALQNEMAAAFVLDLVPPALLIGAIGINLDSALRGDWVRVPLDFVIVALACLAMTVGLGAVVVVVKRDWLVTALFMAILLLSSAAVGVVTVLQVTPSQRLHGLTPRVVEAQLWLLVVGGIVLAWLMRRRFMTMEIGSRV